MQRTWYRNMIWPIARGSNRSLFLSSCKIQRGCQSIRRLSTSKNEISRSFWAYRRLTVLNGAGLLMDPWNSFKCPLLMKEFEQRYWESLRSSSISSTRDNLPRHSPPSVEWNDFVSHLILLRSCKSFFFLSISFTIRTQYTSTNFPIGPSIYRITKRL